MAFVQATVIALADRAILLLGPPGCGKTGLALRMLRHGASLIGDDGVTLVARDGRLMAEPLAQPLLRLRVSGIGSVPVQTAGATPASLVVTGDPAARRRDREAAVDRYGPVDGLWLPQVALPLDTPAAPDMLMLALDRWGH